MRKQKAEQVMEEIQGVLDGEGRNGPPTAAQMKDYLQEPTTKEPALFDMMSI
jgi:hypothetical protein